MGMPAPPFQMKVKPSMAERGNIRSAIWQQDVRSIVILSTPPSALSFNKINSNIPVLTLPTLSLNVLPNKGARAGTCQNLQHDLNIWQFLNILDFHKHICFNRQRRMCYVLNLKWLEDLSIYKPGIRIRSTQEKADSVSEVSFACCQRTSGFIWRDKIWEEVVVWRVLSWSRHIHLAELRCGLADASQDALRALDYISAKRGHFSPSLARQTSVRPAMSAARRLPQEVRVVRCFRYTPEAREQMFGTLFEWHPRAPWASHTQWHFTAQTEMADLTGKDKQGRLPHGGIFTVWSPGSFTPDSDVAAENKIFTRTTHTGSVKTRQHGIQPVLGSSWYCR